jgi:RNA polymerase sigma-70 factor (ECF subfamily)
MDEHGVDPIGAEGLDAVPHGETSFHLRAALSGDAAGLEQAIRRLNQEMLALAEYRLRAFPSALHDPADLVNEIWLRALPHLRRIGPKGGRITPVVVQYLATAMRRRVRDLLETRLRRGESGAACEGDEIPAETRGVITRVMAEEHRGLVHRAIAELDPRDREIILLRAVEQNSTQDVAAVTGLSEDAVRQRYHRALGRLRRQLPDSVFHELD